MPEGFMAYIQPVGGGQHPDQGLPGGGWGGPVDPGYGHPGGRPPRPDQGLPGGRPGGGGGSPDQGLPEPPPGIWPPPRPAHPIVPVPPDLPLEPGTIWPSLPEGAEGKYLVLAWVSGDHEHSGWHYVVVDTSLKPDNELPGEGEGEHPQPPRPGQGLPPQRPGGRPGQGLPPTAQPKQR